MDSFIANLSLFCPAKGRPVYHFEKPDNLSGPVPDAHMKCPTFTMLLGYRYDELYFVLEVEVLKIWG